MPELTPVDEGFSYAFRAMASPCEVRVETGDADLAARLGQIAEAEAARIEAKYSRYREDSFLSRINAAGGEPVTVDGETAALLDYAAQCHDLSGGLFDITSGVLRRIWRFDGSDRVPTRQQVGELLPLIGWDKVDWRRPDLTLPAGMEIDFGGLGKEYAVDSALLKIQAESDVPVLVNFGGDLHVSGPRAKGERWRVAIESVEQRGASEALLELAQGALTTSGDARRFLLKDGVRYSHILDPRTGWPVEDPPRSVTVAAETCMEAGILSTLAMLQGRSAEAFLAKEGVQAWWMR
ncbi:MAG: FAD:protein FMN transferase [Caulobacteraceae bacterium]